MISVVSVQNPETSPTQNCNEFIFFSFWSLLTGVSTISLLVCCLCWKKKKTWRGSIVDLRKSKMRIWFQIHLCFIVCPWSSQLCPPNLPLHCLLDSGCLLSDLVFLASCLGVVLHPSFVFHAFPRLVSTHLLSVFFLVDKFLFTNTPGNRLNCRHPTLSCSRPVPVFPPQVETDLLFSALAATCVRNPFYHFLINPLRRHINTLRTLTGSKKIGEKVFPSLTPCATHVIGSLSISGHSRGGEENGKKQNHGLINDAFSKTANN